MVSKASEDFPEPLRPVMTVSVLRGTSTSIFFRLCWRAPRTVILVMAMEKFVIPSRVCHPERDCHPERGLQPESRDPLFPWATPPTFRSCTVEIWTNTPSSFDYDETEMYSVS